MDLPDQSTRDAGPRSFTADVPDPIWPSIEWPAGPIVRPVGGVPQPKPPKKRGSRWTVALAILGGVLLGTGVTLSVLGIIGVLDPDPISAPPTTVAVATTASLPVVAPPAPGTPLTSVAQVAAIAIPSIVAVEVIDANNLRSSGSGVVYGDSGYVITNNHVIDGAADIFVVFSDGIGYPAVLVGTDPLTDIAVISTTRPDLTPIQLGSEADLVIGETAIAVGNPLGLSGGPSVTTGILSAVGRSLVVEADTTLYGLLQTDAPITRGSSGGALLDNEAKLIGITTAIGISDVGAEGLGFAVPVDIVVGVANDLISDGSVRHALLGISGGSVTDPREEAAVPLGVGVSSMPEGSAYASSGGAIDDVIIALDGEPVTTIEQLIARLRRRRADQSISVKVLRSGEELTLPVTLGEWNDG